MASLDAEKNAYHDVMFHGFEERLKSLERIERYDGMPVMFYRNNLADHGAMVSWVVAEILPYAEKAFPEVFDFNGRSRALTQSLVHDDAEILTGDIVLHDKYHAGKKQLEMWENDEEKAIEELALRYPKTINGFSYKDLLLSAMSKDSVLGQVVSYCDKLVGMGESLHEIYAGNVDFVRNEKNNVPAQLYIQTFRNREDWHQWQDIKPLYNYNHPFLNKPELVNVPKIANDPRNKPHTPESIHKPTGNKFYDKYKEVILEKGGKRGLELLVNQREKLNP